MSAEQVQRELRPKVIEMMQMMADKPKYMDLSSDITNYKEFIKETMANKEQWKAKEVNPFSWRCGTVIRKDILIQTEKENSGSCTIPCHIGCHHFDKVLCDLGLGVSIMPYDVARECGIDVDIKPTDISI